MLNLSQAVHFDDFGSYEAADLIKHVTKYCGNGGAMHPVSLKNVVLKLTHLSREMSIGQDERDHAASLATSLANAAMKAYGSQSEYCQELVIGVQAILGRAAA